MKKIGLQCDICGASESKSGKSFGPAGLAAHRRHFHGSGKVETSQEKESGPADAPSQKNARKRGRPLKALQSEANHVRFCPQCGFNMEVVNAAMALVNGG